MGKAFSDVLTVTKAAIDQMLSGGNPYGHGFAESNPPGAPFAYGPLALLWYLPVKSEPYRLELAISILLLAVLALRGRMLGLAIFATLPPLIVTAADGSNDTSAGLLLLIALLLAPRIPWAGSVALGVAAAFKPYALAWLVPLVPYAGFSVLIPFAAATIVTWGPALLIWGPDNILWSLRQADAIHRTAYYALAYAIGEQRYGSRRTVFSVLRFVAGGLLASLTFSMVRSSRGFIVAGVAIFLATLFLGWWSTFAYVAAIAPILCWHLDDWLGLPRVVWPADPVGAITQAVDRRWPVLRPGLRTRRDDRPPAAYGAAPPAYHAGMTETAQPASPATAEADAPRDVQMLIGGEQVDALDGQTFEVTNPATGKVIARVPLGGKADVDRAVTAAQKAFEGPWSTLVGGQARPHAPEVRRPGQAQRRGAGAAGEPQRRQAHQQRPRSEAFAVSLVLEYYAGAANKHFGETIPTSLPGLDFTLREPIGVVGLIVPWNFPMNMAAWKLGPALAAGNTMILKPASWTPLTAIRLGELALEAGFPARRRQRGHRSRAARPAPPSRHIPASARSPSRARRRPARRSCGWPPAT